jgi:hypothetical protein
VTIKTFKRVILEKHEKRGVLFIVSWKLSNKNGEKSLKKFVQKGLFIQKEKNYEIKGLLYGGLREYGCVLCLYAMGFLSVKNNMVENYEKKGVFLRKK